MTGIFLRPWWRRLSSSRDDRARRRLGLIGVAILSLLVSLVASQTTMVQLAEKRTYDLLSTVSPPAPVPESPILVAIDEPSMMELGGQWPWPRRVHARLIRALRSAGARAIGFDIVFAEPSDAEQDNLLARALGPDIVLAADETVIETPQADQLMRVDPIPDFMAKGALSGVASVSLDADGTLRRIPAYADGFSVRLLTLAGTKTARSPMPGLLLRSAGPPRTYQTVSYYQALDPEKFLPEDIFRGRVVIVGLSMQTAVDIKAGGTDVFATPYTVRSGKLISGAEVQATIYDNLGRNLAVRPVAVFLQLAAALAGALSGLCAVWRATGWKTLVYSALAGLLAIAGSLMLIESGNLYLGPIVPSLAFLLTAGSQGALDFAAERRLRHGITRAFSQYLSPVLVERLSRDPSLLRLGGETRTLTILFCDVRGFTAIAESMKDEPERLTALVNRLLTPLSNVILDSGGTIDKYIGDCIMAFWNAPLDMPDHAERAAGAALKMLEALKTLNLQLAFEEEDGRPVPMALAIGIGINTGVCVVGNMGSDLRFDYSALGDAVNLASRLETETRNQNVPILLGSETARLLAGRFEVVELGNVMVKGKVKPVAISTLANCIPAKNAILEAETPSCKAPAHPAA